MPTDAFEYLVQLAVNVKAIEPGLPAEEEIISKWSGIGFSLLEQRVVAPLGEVVEMLHVPNSARLPGVQSWVAGLANVRGRLLPLFDLEAFLGGKLSANKSKHRVLTLEIGELYAGLIVSDVFGMQHFPNDQEAVDLSQKLQHIAPYSQGAFEQNGMLWGSFSPHNLVRDPRFFNAAAA